MYLGGNTLNFGDQWIISFRRAADRVLVIRRNIKFKADEGSPQADALKVSYNDSVIMSLPIKSEEGHGHRVLVDLADLFMTDLGRIGISPDRTRSTWGKIKAFQENVEIELNAVFGMGLWSYYSIFDSFFGGDSMADSRGVQIVIHYGLSKLPNTGYHPRLADDRVGHFLSTVKDFSNDINDTPQVRYATRWNLEKSNPSADKFAAQKADLCSGSRRRFRVNIAPMCGPASWNGTRPSTSWASSRRSRFASRPTWTNSIPRTSATTPSAGSPLRTASPWAPPGPIPRPARFWTPTSSSTKG